MRKPKRKARNLRSRPTRKAPHQKRYAKAYRTKNKRFRAEEPGSCVIEGGTIVWTLPRKLRSLNDLRSRLALYWDRCHWQTEFDRAVITADDRSIGRCSGKRLRLEVIRYTPKEEWKLDRTNLSGAVKGLEDALVRLKYLVDDSEEWEDGPWVSQKVSTTGKFFTVVKLLPPID